MKLFTAMIAVIGIVFPLIAYIIDPTPDIIWWVVWCIGIWIVVIFVNWIKKK